MRKNAFKTVGKKSKPSTKKSLISINSGELKFNIKIETHLFIDYTNFFGCMSRMVHGNHETITRDKKFIDPLIEIIKSFSRLFKNLTAHVFMKSSEKDINEHMEVIYHAVESCVHQFIAYKNTDEFVDVPSVDDKILLNSVGKTVTPPENNGIILSGDAFQSEFQFQEDYGEIGWVGDDFRGNKTAGMFEHLPNDFRAFAGRCHSAKYSHEHRTVTLKARKIVN